MSTTTIERVGTDSLRVSNPDLPGGEIEVRGGSAEGAVNIAMEFLRHLKNTVNAPQPVVHSNGHATTDEPSKAPTNGRRNRRGISKPRPWSAAEIKMLGTMTDAALAGKIKRTPGAVTAQRKVHNVASFNGSTRRKGRK